MYFDVKENIFSFQINDLAVTCLDDAVGLLNRRHREIKFLVARPVAEVC